MGGYCVSRKEKEEHVAKAPPVNLDGLDCYFFRHIQGCEEVGAGGKAFLDMRDNYYTIKTLDSSTTLKETIKHYEFRTTSAVPRLLATHELELFKKLGHTGILRIHYAEEGSNGLAMGFEGTERTLMDDMNEHFGNATGSAYVDPDVVGIMHQIFSLLAYFHYNGYVHRDIKPENFLLACDDTLSNKLRICSLSSMANLSECDSLKGIVGTYLYMAPEMITGKTYDTAVDVWSAGVIMYMMFTGEHPLIDLGENKGPQKLSYKEQILKALQKEGLRPVDDEKAEVKLLKKSTRDLLVSLLEVDPKKRITAERALRDPWLNSCLKPRKGKCLEIIEDRLRGKQDLHEIIMNIISVVCAPTLKIILLDRMCNPCEYARESGYPKVSLESLITYHDLFYVIDRNGNGYVSKDEISSLREQFPRARLSKGEVSEMLSQFKAKGEYVVSLRTFEHAAALCDLQKKENGMLDALVDTIDKDASKDISLSEIYAAHSGGQFLSRDLEERFAASIQLKPGATFKVSVLKAYLLDTKHIHTLHTLSKTQW